MPMVGIELPIVESLPVTPAHRSSNHVFPTPFPTTAGVRLTTNGEPTHAEDLTTIADGEQLNLSYLVA
jgi:hypothetical protein